MLQISALQKKTLGSSTLDPCPETFIMVKISVLTPASPKTGQMDTSQYPTDLAEIIAAWDHLPDHVKGAVKALVGTCQKHNPKPLINDASDE